LDWIGANAPVITLVVALAICVIGVVACRHRSDGVVGFSQSLGISLLSSGVIAFAVLGLQLMVEQAQDQQEGAEKVTQERNERLLRRESYRLALILSSDLPGFNVEMLPSDFPLREIVFNGKNLESAHLVEAELSEMHFRDANLRGADLTDATLVHTNLLGADFTDAVLEGADLRGADLRSARFEHAAVEHVESLAGAKVNEATCWPQGFLRDVAPTAGLDPGENGSLGHTCTEEAPPPAA
jgi:hypothetical protein